MAINATITGHTGTKAGNFTLNITLDVAVLDLTAASLEITAVSGNGITGVTFEVLPDVDMDATTFNVMFQLPEDVEGSLEFDIIGMLTREGSETPEAVNVTAVTVMYDNITTIAATFGTVDYREGGTVALPVTFGENVIAPSKTVFQVMRLTGDDLSGVDYALVGENAAYELIFDLTGLKGTFRVSADGYVLKASTGVWDDVTATAVDITYNMKAPEFTPELPSVLERGINDLFYDFEELVWKYDSSKIEVVGIAVTPTVYRAIATDVRPAAPEVLGSDWVLATDGHTEHAKFYLFRFDVPSSKLPGGLNVVFDDGAFETVPNVV